MARASIVHKSSFLDFISTLIDHIALIRKYRSNVIFLFLSSDEENFILGLDGCEFLWQYVMVSNCDLDSSLGIQLMNEQTFLLLVVIMESRFDACQNIVGFKTYHIVQETAEFINFTFHFD